MPRRASDRDHHREQERLAGRPRQVGDASPALERIEASLKALPTATHLREEAAETRKEQAERAKADRDEQSAQAKSQREELSKKFADFGSKSSADIEMLGKFQRDRLKDFADQLAKLTEASEKKADALKQAVEKKLEHLQQSNEQKLEKMRQTLVAVFVSLMLLSKVLPKTPTAFPLDTEPRTPMGSGRAAS